MIDRTAGQSLPARRSSPLAAVECAALECGPTLAVMSTRPIIAAGIVESIQKSDIATCVIEFDEVGAITDRGSPYDCVLMEVCGDRASADACAAMTVAGQFVVPIVLWITGDSRLAVDVLQTLEARPAGILDPTTTVDELAMVVKLVREGKIVYHLAPEMGEPSALTPGFGTRGRPVRKSLTNDEIQYLSAVARGQSDEQIAATHYISEATARRRVRALRARTDTHSRAELAAWAGAHGLY